MKISPTSALWGPWGSDSVSSVSGQWNRAWIFDFLGLSSASGCRMDGKPADPWEGLWRIFLSCQLLVHSMAHQCFWLQIVNCNPVWIFLLSPSHLLIFLCPALLRLSQSLREVNIKRAVSGLNWESKGLMWDSQHSSIHTRTVRPRSGAPWAPEWDQYYLFFMVASAGRIKLQLGIK